MEMFTVLPLATSAPEPGLWLSTCPADAPFAHDVSVVVLATSPAPVMAACAAVDGWPMTPGTVTQLEMTRLTELLGGTVWFGAGFWDDTTPLPYWPEHPLV